MLTQQSKDNAFVSRQIASNAILFGKAAGIEQAMRRMSGASAPFIANELSSSDLWIAGDTGLLRSTANTALHAGGPLPAGLDSLKRFALGANFRDPVQLNLNLSMLNEDDARKLLAMYQLLVAQARSQTPEAEELARATKVDVQGSEVHFRFSASVSLLQSQLMKAGMAAGAAGDLGSGALPALMSRFGMGPAAQPAATSAAPAPAGMRPAVVPTVSEIAPPVTPQKPGKIMIYGLEDGPREVGAPKKNE